MMNKRSAVNIFPQITAGAHEFACTDPTELCSFKLQLLHFFIVLKLLLMIYLFSDYLLIYHVVLITVLFFLRLCSTERSLSGSMWHLCENDGK